MNKKKFISQVIRYSIYALVLLFFVWTMQQGYYEKILNEPETFLTLLKQHLELVGVSSLMAMAVALPAGIFVTRPRFRRLEWIVSNVANLGQTIPSLAVLALLLGVLGLGFKTAVFALFIYSVLPIFRNTVAGIDALSEQLIDAARGMGFKPYQILFRIELPNAAYSIFAGIRTAVVLNIGTAALAYLIGGGGFGNWIFTGINLFDNGTLISGAVPVTLLAITADYVFRLLEYAVVPRGARRAAEI